MAFHEVRFPARLSFGSVGGPERRTDVVALASGHEERNALWAHSRRRFDAGVGLRSLDDMEALVAFFEARRGQLHGFRWKDWSDYKSCLPSRDPDFRDQLLAYGDGATGTFQLCKWYRSGEYAYSRPIAKPVAGTVRAGVGDTEQREGVDYEVDTTCGRISFVVAPPTGVDVRAGFEFDVPVRFDTDRIHTSVASFRAGEAPSVPVVELRV
ncbi:DUF2460 domain-containing protein [Roseivivax isoporae]|uniref:Glycoside hydrolase family 24 n=1 Tax=Roseivivax isoporae LMG 25204 TaxID=1449351 RepID=X7F614_9RHOB|nr:DUF2460 domain-containing protein [Roseivivax isoporae]ETX28250.1 glycoside hydrolase family 24 [Roseivivax isoporae LMG 25204]